MPDCGKVFECNRQARYAFAVSGVGGIGVPPPANVNRQWSLSYVTSGWWREAPNGIMWAAVMFYNIPTNANRLRFDDANRTRTIYEAPCFDCEGATTFSLISATAGSGWPSTIVVSRV